MSLEDQVRFIEGRLAGCEGAIDDILRRLRHLEERVASLERTVWKGKDRPLVLGDFM